MPKYLLPISNPPAEFSKDSKIRPKIRNYILRKVIGFQPR